MADVDIHRRKTWRGTWAQILAHQDEVSGMSEVEVRVLEPEATTDVDRTIALLESWIAQAPADQQAMQEAEADLREFKRNMNRTRMESGARLPYPEAE